MLNPLVYVVIAAVGLNAAAYTLLSPNPPPEAESPEVSSVQPEQASIPAEKIESLKPPSTLPLSWKTTPTEPVWCDTTLTYKYAKTYTTTFQGKKIKLTYLVTNPGLGEELAVKLQTCPTIKVKNKKDMLVILDTASLASAKLDQLLDDAYKKANRTVGKHCTTSSGPDQGRNPYMDNYKRNKQTATLTSPTSNPVADPALFVSSIKAARQQAQPTYTAPKPQPQPQLAPLIAGTGSSTQTAIKGPTPKLINPYSLPDPGYTPKPSKPEIPQPTYFSFETQFTRTDPQGPGCGWSFTGTIPPAYDDKTVEGSNQTAALSALTDINQQNAAWLNNQLSWSDKLQQYTTQYTAWLNYTTYLDIKQQAQLQWDQAQQTYDESVYNYYPDPATVPTPTPNATDTAQIPVTTPTPELPQPTESGQIVP